MSSALHDGQLNDITYFIDSSSILETGYDFYRMNRKSLSEIADTAVFPFFRIEQEVPRQEKFPPSENRK